MSMETVQASRVRKGSLIVVNGTTVRVTKREKWNSKTVRVHFEDAGNGLPLARFGSCELSISFRSFDLADELTLGAA